MQRVSALITKGEFMVEYPKKKIGIWEIKPLMFKLLTFMSHTFQIIMSKKSDRRTPSLLKSTFNYFE